jgi:PAS domain-containing protein
MANHPLARVKLRDRAYHHTPAWLLTVLIGSVFLIDVLVVLLLEMLPRMSRRVSIFLDAILLCVLLFPILYWLVFRPLMRNITERMQAEDELRVAAVAFESKDPILITDAQATIVRANKMFLNITGYKLEKIPASLNQDGMARRFTKKCGNRC